MLSDNERYAQVSDLNLPYTELVLAKFFIGASFPEFVVQHKALPGRKYKWDFCFPEYKVLVEVQGGIWTSNKSAHSTGSGIRRDAVKSALVQCAGFLSILITTDMLSGQGLQALRIVALALISRGWEHPEKDSGIWKLFWDQWTFEYKELTNGKN